MSHEDLDTSAGQLRVRGVTGGAIFECVENLLRLGLTGQGASHAASGRRLGGCMSGQSDFSTAGGRRQMRGVLIDLGVIGGIAESTHEYPRWDFSLAKDR